MTNGTLHAGAGSASGRSSAINRKIPGTFGGGWRPRPSERDIASVADDLGADLDQLLLSSSATSP